MSMNPNEPPDLLDAVLRRFAEILGPEIAKALRGVSDEWIPQDGSPLGNRRHCTAVRRRVAKGDLGAVVDGKRFLLSRGALQEEMRALGNSPAAARAIGRVAAPGTPAAKASAAVKGAQSAGPPEPGSVRERIFKKLGRL
jgi:hypothetical protein